MNLNNNGYRMENGRWADLPTATLIDGALTANGASEACELGDRGTVRVDLATTAASGTTPTLDVTIETSKTGAGGWTNLGTMTQVTGVATARKVFAGCDRFVRASYTIGGTAAPSFTTKLSIEAC